MLCASWARLMGETNTRYVPLLQELPKRPSSEEFDRWKRLVYAIVDTCDDILRVLIEEGVSDTLNPTLTAVEEGVPVADEIRRPVIEFWNAFTIMFFQLRPMAVGWLTRLEERIELDRDLEERAEAWRKEHSRVPS